MTRSSTYLFLLFVALYFGTNALWYRIKFLLRDRGYPVSYFRHLQDLRHLDQLIATSPPDAQRLRQLRAGIYLCLTAALGAFACFMIIGLLHA